jgi:hypothetical protein
MMWLTKSRFMSGRQCIKRLWFETHEPLEGAPAESMPLVNGRTVDRLVQQLEPGPVVSHEDGMRASVEETRRILSSDPPSVLYQGAFQEGSLAAVADILRRTEKGFELVEVKASTSVKEEHLPDAAFQVLLLERAGLAVGRAHVGHVNNQFVLATPGDYRGLFVESDVTKPLRELLPKISDQAAEFIRVVEQDAAPDVSMGDHCEVPHVCPFTERCKLRGPPQPDFPLSILPRGGKVVAQLRADGYTDLRAVPAERLKSEVHLRIHAAAVSGQAKLDREATAELRNHAPPFAYLDFETITFAVPVVIGTRPYEQCPFQWSVHVERTDGTLDHAEFLAIEDFGNFEDLASRLLTALPGAGPVFVYNQTLEKGVLELLARLVPGLAPRLNDVVSRLVDLWPITKAAYYHPDMLGSWSLKDVAPTVDPTLNYKTLEGVQEGDAAQLAFVELRNGAPDAARRAELQQQLKTYCRQDTYALVVLRRLLCGS